MEELKDILEEIRKDVKKLILYIKLIPGILEIKLVNALYKIKPELAWKILEWNYKRALKRDPAFRKLVEMIYESAKAAEEAEATAEEETTKELEKIEEKNKR